MQPLPENPRTVSLAIKYIEGWMYSTSISLGSPAQNFTAAIDIDWSDVFVPSTTCLAYDRPEYCKPHPLCNSSSSSTHAWDGRNVSVNHYGFVTKGNAVSDTLRLGSPVIEVQHQVFEAAYQFRPTYFFKDHWYDTVLGLSLQTVCCDGSDLRANSPFQNMMQQKLLQHNAFSLALPRPPEETGRLVFDGHYVEKEVGYVTTVLPLADIPNSALSGGWQVAVESIQFGTEHYPLDLHAAVFSTISPFVDLPNDLAWGIRKAIGVDIADGIVDCDRFSANLPDLGITLSSDTGPVVLKLSPDDYISKELKLPFVDSDRCIIPIVGHEVEENRNYIVLGTTFLRKFVDVLDADRKSIKLIQRDDSQQSVTTSMD